MEEMSDMKIFYHKLHKYRKLVEKLLGISVKRSDRNTSVLENNIDKLFEFISNNIKKIDYDLYIISYLSRLIFYDWVDFKYVSRTPEYRIFYEIRNLNKLVNKISDHVQYTKGTREYKILMECDRFSGRFERLIKISDNIKEIIDNLHIDEDQENFIHLRLFKLKNQYVKSIRSTKILPVMIGNVLKGKPGRIEVKLNCGIVKPRLNGTYTLRYNHINKHYENEFISISCEYDLDSLPNQKEIEIRGEMIPLCKVCILKTTGDIGELLFTPIIKIYEDGCGYTTLYPFSDGSLYATFSTKELKSLI